MRTFLSAAFAGFLLIFPAWAEEINDLNITDASNTTRWPEGMAAGTVNDSARALEGLLARFYQDINASVATTGSANAYALSANQTLGAYYDGLFLGFDANHTNTGAATLNVDSLGAKTIKKHGDQDLASGDIESGSKYLVVYDGTNFQLLSGIANAPAATAVDNNFSEKQTIVSTDPDALEDKGLDLYRNSASPAANDNLDPVRFKGEDSAGNETTYCKILPILDDPTDTSEDGRLRLDCQVAGSLTQGFSVGTSIFADGNTDPGPGKIDADDVLISGASLTSLKVGQIQTAATTTAGSTTTAIPDDDTIPQNTEGAEVITASITPINASSTIKIEGSLNVSANTVGPLIIAAFKDSDADAIWVGGMSIGSSGVYPQQAAFHFFVAATDTSARTYKIRIGVPTGTAWWNSNQGSARFSTAGPESRLTLAEVLP